MPAIHFTRLFPPDIQPVIEIEKACFRWPWQPFLFWHEIGCADSRSYAIRYTENGNGSRIIAYTCQRLLSNELHILKIAVIRQWRHFGIGSWFLRKCIGLALEKGACKAFLCVRPSNHAAVHLYYKLGFQVIGESPGYYSETGEDALVMGKNLKE